MLAMIIACSIAAVVLIVCVIDIVYLNHKINVLQVAFTLSSRALELIEKTGVDVNKYINEATELIRQEGSNGKRYRAG